MKVILLFEGVISPVHNVQSLETDCWPSPDSPIALEG